MKVENKFVIDGLPVEKLATFADITVYSVGDDCQKTVYFTVDSVVVQVLNITANMSQSVGYIDTFQFSN